MRQIAFARQPSFEKYARKSRREEFLNTWTPSFRGLNWSLDRSALYESR